MATFVPVIGSGFDAIADQQRQWAGFNANTERQNLDSFARATEARNNYFQTVAEMQRADAERQRQQDAADQAEAVRQYQFNVNTQLDKNQQDIERQKIKATEAAKTYTEQRKQALADAKDNEIAADALASEGHFNSADEINAALPNSTPLVKAALWQKNQQARQQLSQQYNFTSGIAAKENKKAGLTDLAASLPNSKDVQPVNPTPSLISWRNLFPPTAVGNFAGWLGAKTAGTPDTSWYDARKAAIGSEATNLGRELAPVEKQGLDVNGIVLDPATGKYRPISTPSWLQGQPSQASNSMPPAPANPAARKVGMVYMSPKGVPVQWTGTGWIVPQS